MWQIAQSLVAISYTGCIIKWPAVEADDLDGYHVYMRAGLTGTFERMTIDPITDGDWESPPLRNDMRYYFYITSVDTGDNESAPSQTIVYSHPDATDEPVIFVASPIAIKLQSTTEKEFSLSEYGTDICTSFVLGGTS